MLYTMIKRRFFYMSHNTLKTNAYNISLEVMTKFEIFIFRFVSQSANKLKTYVWCFTCKIMLK